MIGKYTTFGVKISSQAFETLKKKRTKTASKRPPAFHFQEHTPVYSFRVQCCDHIGSADRKQMLLAIINSYFMWNTASSATVCIKIHSYRPVNMFHGLCSGAHPNAHWSMWKFCLLFYFTNKALTFTDSQRWAGKANPLCASQNPIKHSHCNSSRMQQPDWGLGVAAETT